MLGTFTASQIILIMVGICIAFMLMIIFQKQLKYILQFVVQGTIGVVGIIIVNLLLSTVGIELALGINLLTLLIIGSLGLPGFAMLYLTMFML